MFTKTTTAESLAAERAELGQIQKKKDELLEAAQSKRALHEDQVALVARMTSPEGVCESTDEEIAREEGRRSEYNRDFLRAEGALRKFANGDGANLESRFRDLATRDEEFRYGKLRKALRTRLAKRLAALAALAAEEFEIEAEAIAAGYRRGPIRLLSSTRNERNPFDVWRYDLCGFDVELLPASDPQRRLYENANAVRTAA
jgi:hypothetical protein